MTVPGVTNPIRPAAAKSCRSKRGQSGRSSEPCRAYVRIALRVRAAIRAVSGRANLAHSDLRWCVGAVAVLALSSVATAGFTIQTSTNPMNWQVGKPETVAVWIDEASLPGPLVFVGVTVEFDGAVLGEPTLPSAGGIVPSPTWDPSDFLAFSNAGMCDASFATASTDPAFQISSGGKFMEFSLTPVAPGAGTIQISFAQALYIDSTTGDRTDAGFAVAEPVPFSVSVPTPGWAGVVAAWALCTAAKRRRA